MTAPDAPAAGAVIVVGVDGSPGSAEALTWAARQAELTGAGIRAVASWRWPNYVTRVPPGADPGGDTARTLRETVAPIRQVNPGLEISEHVVQGPPGPSLLTQATGASLLVVGARGRAAFPGMLLGSVAEYCVRNGPCPVSSSAPSTTPDHARLLSPLPSEWSPRAPLQRPLGR